MIFTLNLIRHATFHGHNSMYVRRPDPFSFREGCGYARLSVYGMTRVANRQYMFASGQHIAPKKPKSVKASKLKKVTIYSVLNELASVRYLCVSTGIAKGYQSEHRARDHTESQAGRHRV